MTNAPPSLNRLSKPVSVLRVVLLVSFLTGSGCGRNEQADPSTGGDSPAPLSSPETESAPAAAFEPEEGFALLSLDNFEVFHGKPPVEQPTWSEDGTTISCTGVPRGYLRSKSSYANFTLRFDYRFEPPETEDDPGKANTGCLVYGTGENRLWPICLEVQGKHAEMGAIKANGRSDVLAADSVTDDEPARVRARRPAGEWNSVEIVSRDGALVSFLNGEKICENRAGELSRGFIGFQSEDFAVHFRNIRIRAD